MSSPTAGRDDPMFAASTRVAYFPGQRLAAQDLTDAGDQQRRLRWLHNRGLHGWGIALGFEVAGQPGEKVVSVRPGYALDCRGRELILTEPLTRSVPARSGDDQGKAVTYYLVAAYPDDERLPVVERRGGDCGTDGAVRLQERAEVYWTSQIPGEGLEIILATAMVRNCRLDAPLSLAQRRPARPAGQPFVAAGETPSPGTSWELWRETIGGQAATLGVKVAVATRTARFGSAPHYLAQLRGPRFFPRSQLGPSITIDVVPGLLLIDGTGIVVAPGRDGFAFHVILTGSLPNQVPAATLLENAPDGLLALLRSSWSVAWTGVEM